MRIISFSKKWDKLKQTVFTTFRFPRADADKGRDWHEGETVQVYYKSRTPERMKYGEAVIVKVEKRFLGNITNAEAKADGFPGGLKEMVAWLLDTHGKRVYSGPMNKLTLEWIETNKPCDNCTTNIDQAIQCDEITCYLTCEDFKKWQAEHLAVAKQ